MNQGCHVAQCSFFFPYFPMISASASYLCQFTSLPTLLPVPWYVSQLLASLPSDAGGFLTTVITFLCGQEPAVFLVLFNFFISVPIPLCPFVLLAWRRPDRGQMVSSSQGGSAKPHTDETPWRGLCYFLLGLNRHKMVIGAYFQPLHNMALKITCPTDGEGLFGNPKYSPLHAWEPRVLSSLGRLMAVVCNLSSGRYPVCTVLSRTGK